MIELNSIKMLTLLMHKILKITHVLGDTAGMI